MLRALPEVGLCSHHAGVVGEGLSIVVGFLPRADHPLVVRSAVGSEPGDGIDVAYADLARFEDEPGGAPVFPGRVLGGERDDADVVRHVAGDAKPAGGDWRTRQFVAGPGGGARSSEHRFAAVYGVADVADDHVLGRGGAPEVQQGGKRQNGCAESLRPSVSSMALHGSLSSRLDLIRGSLEPASRLPGRRCQPCLSSNDAAAAVFVLGSLIRAFPGHDGARGYRDVGDEPDSVGQQLRPSGRRGGIDENRTAPRAAGGATYSELPW